MWWCRYAVPKLWRPFRALIYSGCYWDVHFQAQVIPENCGFQGIPQHRLSAKWSPAPGVLPLVPLVASLPHFPGSSKFTRYTVFLLFLNSGGKFLLVFLSFLSPSPQRSYQSFRLSLPSSSPKIFSITQISKEDRKGCLQQPWLSHPLLLKVSEVKNLNELDYLLRTNEWKQRGTDANYTLWITLAALAIIIV